MTQLRYENKLRPKTFDILGCRSGDGESLNDGGSDDNPGRTCERSLRSGDGQKARTSTETPAEPGDSSPLASENSSLLLEHIADYEIRVTLLWSGKGSINSNGKTPTASRLEEWAAAERVPDVFVIGEYRDHESWNFWLHFVWAY